MSVTMNLAIVVDRLDRSVDYVVDGGEDQIGNKNQ